MGFFTQKTKNNNRTTIGVLEKCVYRSDLGAIPKTDENEHSHRKAPSCRNPKVRFGHFLLKNTSLIEPDFFNILENPTVKSGLHGGGSP